VLLEKTIPWAITDLTIKVAKEEESTQEKLVEEHTRKPVKIESSFASSNKQNVPRFLAKIRQNGK
jgi:hypothetical protein